MNRWFILIPIFSFMYLGVAFLFATKPTEVAVDIPPTPKEYLFQNCRQPDCDPYMLDAIATCESQWRMVQNNHSSAHGYFQILDSTEKTTPQWKEGGRKYDPYTNVDMGIFLYESRGSQPWYPSEPCWHWKYRYSLADRPNLSLGVRKYN